MLRFFRKIRRDLLAKSQFFRYLKYAIGEILLVVIGILIALQVNNWNEERLTDQAIDKVLKKLRADLYYDLEQFDTLDSIHDVWEGHNEFIQNIVLSGKLKKLDSYNQFTAGRGSFLYLTIKNSTQLEMINTGLMYQLDSTLQRGIDNYYELSRFEMEKLNGDLRDFAAYIQSYERRKPINVGVRLWTGRNLEYLDWSWLDNPNSEQYIDIENLTVWHQGLIDDYRMVLDKIRNQAIITIERIEIELTR